MRCRTSGLSRARRSLVGVVLLAGLVPVLLPASASAGACGITAIGMSDLSPAKDGEDVADRRTTTKDVGQETTLSAARTAGVLAPTATSSFRWTVGGDAIRDYTDVVKARDTSVRGKAVVEYAPTPFVITEADDRDDQGRSIFQTTAGQLTFYFRMAGPTDPALPAAVPVTAQLREQHAGDGAPHDCAGVTAQTTFTVDRNKTDEERQPEDYYVEINHSRRVYATHQYWHDLHNIKSIGYDGADFLTFHHDYLTGYDGYRATFGYPSKDEFVPTKAFTPVPLDEDGFTLAHDPRKPGNHGDSTCKDVRPKVSPPSTPGSCAERPPWLVRRAQNPSGVTPRNVAPACMKVPRAHAISSLDDFGTERSWFGCMLEFGWHGGPHNDIGGDMGNSGTAHRDPVFWRWHGYVDSIYQDYLNLTGLPSSHSVLATAPTSAAVGRCLGLVPTITGTRRADVLRGTAGRDVIAGGRGDDVIRGLGGEDVICGDRGDDRIFAGDGEDDVIGESGEDVLHGQGSADGLSGGKGDDRLLGGSGADKPDGGSGDDLVAGGGGDEWMMFGGPGDDRVRGGPGNDHLHGGLGDDRLAGGPGDDGLVGEGGDDELDGGPGHDHVSYLSSPQGIDVDLGDGTARGYGADELDGVEGVLGSGFDDRIEGGHHPEELEGGFGDDRIDGGGGGDTLRGGEDRDVVSGEGGPDFCVDTESEESCAESSDSPDS